MFMDFQKRNISFTDLILNYFSYFKLRLNIFKKIPTFLVYRRLYRNYFTVYKSVSWKRYPIEAIMRNGDPVVLRNSLEAQMYDGRHKGYECDITNDIVTLSALNSDRKKINLTIYGGTSNGDIKGIFVDNIYQHLPVKNKNVIDIGANIGDSAIYFAINGATKVISLEPFPKNYELAEKNIKLNNFSDHVTLLLAGCSGNRNEITIDPDFISGNSTILKEFKIGIKVPLMTLEDILKGISHSDNSIILKMDCEGCEYETIISANENTLQRFSHIMIEYHFGYKNLKEKLEKNGFKVSITRPHIYWYSPDELQGNTKFVEGYIIAERR